MATIQELTDAAAAKNLGKTSWAVPNVANTIAEHLRKVAPELCDIPGLWFSGSNVWRHLYACDPPARDADLDVFFVGGHLESKTILGLLGDQYVDRREALLDRLGVPKTDRIYPTVKTGPAGDNYAQGCHALYQGRKLDVWCNGPTVQDVLSDYPKASHAHCRAAFSFEHGLVVLPNECAK